MSDSRRMSDLTDNNTHGEPDTGLTDTGLPDTGDLDISGPLPVINESNDDATASLTPRSSSPPPLNLPPPLDLMIMQEYNQPLQNIGNIYNQPLQNPGTITFYGNFVAYDDMLYQYLVPRGTYEIVFTLQRSNHGMISGERTINIGNYFQLKQYYHLDGNHELVDGYRVSEVNQDIALLTAVVNDFQNGANMGNTATGAGNIDDTGRDV